MIRALLSIILLIFSKNIFAIDLTAKYSILMDYDTKEVLYEKKAYVSTEPSSMSKLMSCYIIFEKIKHGEVQLDDLIPISKKAWKKGGSKMFVEVGKKVKLEDLILGLIVQSGNDATIAISEYISGSEEAFVELMNEKALELDLVKSTFVNSTGWPDKKHKMSTYDIAFLSKKLLDDFPEYYHYFSVKEFAYNNIKQPNRNGLLFCNMADGIKTGRTDAGEFGLVSSSKRADRRLIAVVNGCKTDAIRTAESKILLNYGFNAFSNVKITKSGDVLGEIKLHNGSEYVIPLKSHYNLLYTAPKRNLSKINAKIIYKEPIIAPVKKDDVIAHLVVEGIKEEQITLDLKADKNYAEASVFIKMLRKFYFSNIKNKLVKML